MTNFILYAGKPDQVRDLAYVVTSLTAVNITWSKPDDNNSPVTHYVVACGRKYTLQSVEVKDDTFVIIDGLVPGYLYGFTVAAVNDIGEGRKSDIIQIQSANSGMPRQMF